MNNEYNFITILLITIEICISVIIYKRININYNRLLLINQNKLDSILHEYNNIIIIILSIFILTMMVDIYIYIYILLFIVYFKLERINKHNIIK